MAGIKYTVGSNWGSGFVGNMAVTGDTEALQGWTVEFDASFTISNIWGAEIVSHVGNHYVIRNLDYDATVPAGGQVSFGFQAAGGTTATGLTVNGTGSAPPPDLPTLSIDDASSRQRRHLAAAFTVKLQAATGPVTVNYTTNGTATAGRFRAQRRELAFAAGNFEGDQVNGDTSIGGHEMLGVTPDASGATIADGSATGTIVNDDVAAPPPTGAPPPTLSPTVLSTRLHRRDGLDRRQRRPAGLDG